MWMTGLAILLGLIVAWVVGRRLVAAWQNYWSRIEQQRHRLEQLRHQICQLPLAEARTQAKQALLSEWVLEAKPAALPLPALVHSLPATIRKLAEEYEEIVTIGQAWLYPGRPEPTHWRPNCYRIGWGDEDQTVELVVCLNEDTLYELDWIMTESSREPQSPKVSTYPSIYHWIVYDFALFREE
jgi:hypothetical protein